MQLENNLYSTSQKICCSIVSQTLTLNRTQEPTLHYDQQKFRILSGGHWLGGAPGKEIKKGPPTLSNT